MLNAVLAMIANLCLSGSRAILRQAIRFSGLPPYQDSRHHAVKHVVIFRSGTIGDTVVALPAMFYIRQRFPEARITLVTSPGEDNLPGAAEVVTPFEGLVDELIAYRPSDFRTSIGLHRLSEKVLNRGGPVDLFVNLPVSVQSLRRALQELTFAKALKSKSILGFGLMFPPVFRPAWSRKYPERIERTSDWLVRLVNPEDHPIRPRTGSFPPVRWEQWGLDANLPILVVNTGSKQAIKRWPINSFVELMTEVMKDNPQLQVAFVGNGAEEAVNQRIIDSIMNKHPMMSVALVNLSGKLSLSETWGLINKASFVISNDTGTMHMAGILNKPVFSPVSGQFPAPLWHPPGRSFVIFRRPVKCSPCFKEVCPLWEQICLTRIQPQEVHQAIREAMGVDIGYTETA